MMVCGDDGMMLSGDVCDVMMVCGDDVVMM